MPRKSIIGRLVLLTVLLGLGLAALFMFRSSRREPGAQDSTKITKQHHHHRIHRHRRRRHH